MISSELRRPVVSGLLAVLLAGTASAAPAASVYELIDARLEHMRGVAAHKWHHDLPVEDPPREAVVLEQAVSDALRYGFTVGSSRAFFTAQMDAAKQVQRHFFEVWSREGEPPHGQDLGSIRPELSRLGREILAAAAVLESPSEAAFRAAVAVRGLDDGTRDAIFAALAGLERYSDRLRQILDSGVLRIGTTGDYAPFSHRADDAPLSGIDIDLARHLAGALEVAPVFVTTTWPALMQDLAEGAYDIAMSGVSRTLDRQRHGYLSQPYYVGGKTPIARCGEEGSYNSLAAIDRREVRVIVNPGGTNEQFVDRHLRRAKKVLHQDNRTIFAALEEGVADVMITDRVEVELQTRVRPALCATMAEPLTYQEKAYLLPQDEPWRAFVDTWLALAQADGTVTQVFRAHGVELRPPGRRR